MYIYICMYIYIYIYYDVYVNTYIYIYIVSTIIIITINMITYNITTTYAPWHDAGMSCLLSGGATCLTLLV